MAGSIAHNIAERASKVNHNLLLAVMPHWSVGEIPCLPAGRSDRPGMPPKILIKRMTWNDGWQWYPPPIIALPLNFSGHSYRQGTSWGFRYKIFSDIPARFR